jgi:hypothetical protein
MIDRRFWFVGVAAPGEMIGRIDEAEAVERALGSACSTGSRPNHAVVFRKTICASCRLRSSSRMSLQESRASTNIHLIAAGSP